MVSGLAVSSDLKLFKPFKSPLGLGMDKSSVRKLAISAVRGLLLAQPVPDEHTAHRLWQAGLRCSATFGPGVAE